MNVLWLVPPSPYEGNPNVGQYRFFKVMSTNSSIIYPYLNASGVTMLRDAWFDVQYLDCPTLGLDKDNWKVHRKIQNADIVIMEARTPIMQHIWNWTANIFGLNPDAKTILYGDHVTAFPEETLKKSFADFVVCSGDYDLAIVDLCKNIRSGTVASVMNYYPLTHDMDALPFVDRELVDWTQYYEAWRHRETFFWTMSGRGCRYWCTFCAWVGTFWNHELRLRSVKNVADEFEMLYDTYGECEILDDIDLFVTRWGNRFATELLSRGFKNKEILWAIQTHPNEIHNSEYLHNMANSGCKTVKLGIESLNDTTLKRINKSTTVKQIRKAFKILKDNDIVEVDATKRKGLAKIIRRG